MPRAGSAVEVYSQTAGTWLPATVLAVDGGDLHILLDSSAREKWATASEWREPVIADSRKVASSRRALPPPRRGTAAAYVASDRPGTAPAATQPTRAPKRPAAISPATEPLKVGDSHMQVFSASAGRWVDALVVEVDRESQDQQAGDTVSAMLLPAISVRSGWMLQTCGGSTR